MTFQELENRLISAPSLSACEAWLKSNADAIRELFYQDVGVDASAGGHDGELEFAAEDVLITFLNRYGQLLRESGHTPAAVRALLIYFISICERAGFYASINRIANKLPAGPLRSRAEAIFMYKQIATASHDYIARFNSISTALQSVWDEEIPSLQRQCEYLALEYFCSASDPERGRIGENNRKELSMLFTRHADKYSFLTGRRITDLLQAPDSALPEIRRDANIRIAEFFYDEAASLLPLQKMPLRDSVCAGESHVHNRHCPPGLSDARIVLAERYAVEFANTGYFIQQPLTKDVYIDFDDPAKCMRYFRQYMPLHIPQVEQAVRNTLDRNSFGRKDLHIIDIGGGPGTLYVVLAGLLDRGFYPGYTFNITLVEPSRTFHDFLRVISQYVRHDALRLRNMYICTSEGLPDLMSTKDADWYFLANIITPLVRGSNVTGTVDHLCDLVAATCRDQSAALMTFAENTNSVDFDAVCAQFSTRGFECQRSESSCPADWLAGCKFYITGPRRLTRPRLKYGCISFPKRNASQ